MKTYNLEDFREDCKSMGVSLTENQIALFQRYYEILSEWNTFMNLTAITDFADVLRKHFLDSLAVTKAVDITSVHTLIDVGTGAGFPGIPLKIAFPHLHILLLDSLGKRVKFLNHVIEELKLEDIAAIHGRAEDFARKEEYREKFDLVVSRAVANLSTLSEYCIPYTILTGRFISYKSGKIEEELSASQKAISILGGEIEKIEKFSLPDIGERSLVVIKKIKKTQKKYPRKAGLPSQEPL